MLDAQDGALVALDTYGVASAFWRVGLTVKLFAVRAIAFSCAQKLYMVVYDTAVALSENVDGYMTTGTGPWVGKHNEDTLALTAAPIALGTSSTVFYALCALGGAARTGSPERKRRMSIARPFAVS